MCVGKYVYLYVDEGIFQMSVCEQNTFTAHCMHFFKFTYNPTILYQNYIRQSPIKDYLTSNVNVNISTIEL